MPAQFKSKLQQSSKNPYEVFLNNFQSEGLKQESTEVIKNFIEESCKVQTKITDEVHKARLEEFAMKRMQKHVKADQS